MSGCPPPRRPLFLDRLEVLVLGPGIDVGRVVAQDREGVADLGAVLAAVVERLGEAGRWPAA